MRVVAVIEGGCPRGAVTPHKGKLTAHLGCSLVLSRSEKEQSPLPHCRNHAANRKLQSCPNATKRTPLKLLPLCPQGTPLSPAGKLKTPNRPPNSKRRLSAQARGSLQLPRNARPVPTKGKGEMPKRGTPLGCSLVLSRSEKEQEPYPRCDNCAVTRNPQSCFIAS